MTVDPAQARGRAQHQGEILLLLLAGMHAQVRLRSRQISRRPRTSPAACRREATVQIGATCKIERDPVCGMNVDPREGCRLGRARPQALSLLLQGLRRKVQGRSAEISFAQLQARRHGIEPDGDASADSRSPASPASRSRRRPHRQPSPRLQRRPAPSGSAPCVPRCASRSRCPVPSAAWRSSRKRPSPLPPAPSGPAPCIPRSCATQPGFCPICGMALEPRTVTAAEEENPELRDMTRRFWWSVMLGVPLVALGHACGWGR